MMNAHDCFLQPIQEPLDELEQLSRQWHLTHKDFMATPHTVEDYASLYQKGERLAQKLIPNFKIPNGHLEEEKLFQTTGDTEVYRHRRYAPYSWHCHSFFEIVCVMQGHCTNSFPSHSLSMCAGDICIIAPNTMHAIGSFDEESIILNILIRSKTFETAFFGVLSEKSVLSSFFLQTLYQSEKHPYLYFKSCRDQELFNLIARAYDEYWKHRSFRDRMLNNIIDTLFILLLRNHAEKIQIPSLEKQSDSETAVYILSYIQSHFTTVSLQELSEFFHYSTRQLQRIISAATGKTFRELIREMKMQEADKLLRRTTLSISDIAGSLGYPDEKSFRTAFTQHFYMAPGIYRKQL